MIDLGLIQQCAGGLDYPVAHAIIKQESAFNPFAIGVNKGGKAVPQPKNYAQAVATAKQPPWAINRRMAARSSGEMPLAAPYRVSS